MGYNRKRIKGIHRIYDQQIDWEVSIENKKRFVVDTLPYGKGLTENDIKFLHEYCNKNEYPFGIVTNGDDFAIVSSIEDDEQPILKQSAIQNPDDALKILDLYSYKNYDIQKIKEYYMQFQFTLEKLRDILKNTQARQQIYDKILEIAGCTNSVRNKNIVKKFIDKQFDESHSKEDLEKEKDTLKSEIADYKEHIEEYKKLQQEVQQVNVQSDTIKVETNTDTEALLDELVSTKSEIEQLKAQINENIKEIAKLQKEKEDILKINNELISNVENLKETEQQTDYKNSNTPGDSTQDQKEDELIKQIESLELKDKQLMEANNQINALKMEIEQIKKSHNIQADEVQLEIGGSNENLIKGLISENNQLKAQIDLMTNNDSLSGQTEAFAIEVGKYREQIQKLINENSKLTQELEQQRIKIGELSDKLVSKGQAKQVAAQELLDSIQDDEQQERTYVAVIDDNLFQERDIRKFVGICIEELYKTAAVTLMPMLYDSQNFILKEAKDQESCDFTLGTKRFILDIENDTEDSLIAKVVQMYAEYKDRIFLCKKIGTAKANFDDLYKEKKSNDELQVDEYNSEDINRQDNSDNYKETYKNEEQDLELNDKQSIGYAFFGIRGQDSLLYYKDAKCLGIKYLCSDYNQRYYQIDDTQLEQQLVGCIQALIASCPTNLEEALAIYKNPETFQDFKGILEPIQASNKTKTKLPNSKLVIEKLDSLKDVTNILQKVANIFGHSEEYVTLVYKIIYYKSDKNLQYCLADLSLIPFQQNIEYPGDTTGELFEKGIDGGIVDNITLSRNQLEIQSKLFKGLTRVITNDMNQEIVDDSQFQKAVSTMLNKAIQNKEKIIPNKIGTIVGSNKLILSTNKLEVYENYVEVKAGNQVYYIQRLEPIQQMYAFIKMQQVLFGNKQIKFIMNISKNAFDFYKNEFTTNNPSLDMIVNMIIKYIETRL